ncbi:MAG TPA: 2OG-Fe(II) oxygenase [Lysobacter sp.]
MTEPLAAPIDVLRANATGGEPEALYRLAVALVAQHRVEEAFDLHRRAAQAGHASALIEHARMLLYGVGTAAQPRVAVEALLRAEAMQGPGSVVAGYYLALVAIGGVALPFDQRVNARVLAAVNAGFPPALRAAAIHFGRKPDPTDQQRCLQLLELAASHGDVVAAQLLAERLAHGEGCDVDAQAAERLRAQLAQQGILPLPAVSARGVVGPPCQPGTLALDDALWVAPGRTLAERPRVAVVDDLLSADECRLLIASAQPTLKPSQAIDPVTGTPLAMQLRTSSDASFDPLVEDLALRLVQLRLASAARARLIQAEQLTVLRYEPGQEYRPHRDYRPPGSIEHDRAHAGNRGRTICVYLNEPEAGGETEFPLAGLTIAPRVGSAIVFDNLLPDGNPDLDSLHAGRPVQRGEKWLATLWLRQRRYREF